MVSSRSAYTDPGGEERLWQAFGGARGQDVAADWRDRWKAFHHPVRVGRLWIGPPWHDPPDDATAIVIDPGVAPSEPARIPTTQLLVELMLEIEPASAVDFGSGSGVLAIVAAKLGFDPVIALDTGGERRRRDARERRSQTASRSKRAGLTC